MLTEVATEGRQARTEPLGPQVPNRPHFYDGQYVLRIGFDATLRHDEPEKLLERNPKDTFLVVELDLLSSEVPEGFFEVDKKLHSLWGLDNNVINIHLEVLIKLLFTLLMHC
jgi:hypothetical protein